MRRLQAEETTRDTIGLEQYLCAVLLRLRMKLDEGEEQGGCRARDANQH